VRVALSSVYQAMGKHDEAEAQLRKVLETGPHDATANNNLGYLLAERNKDLAEAERLIRKALELDKQLRGATAPGVEREAETAAYVDSLGWVLFRRGKLDEARQKLERAAKLPDGEDDPVVWDHLGDVHFRQKQPAKAAEAWRKALALYDQGARRKAADRYKEIQDKLRLAKP
jgi:Tfp pilus assembly protein PilF